VCVFFCFKMVADLRAQDFQDVVKHRDGKDPRNILQWNGFTIPNVPELHAENFGLPFHQIDNAVYPPWITEGALRGMQERMAARPGDVFVVSHFPIRGLQRLLVAMIEGRENPWEQGLIDKPHFLEGGASKRGLEAYLEEIASWQGRRCFKSHSAPENFPCQWRSLHADSGIDGQIPPKIVVLVADPRYDLAVSWEIMKDKIPGVSMSLFIEAFLDKRWSMFGDYFVHGSAWAAVAAENPKSVRLFSVEQFASCDPKVILAAVAELAEFLEIPSPSTIASRLTTAIVERPSYASCAVAMDDLPCQETIGGGPLVELAGPRLQLFEEALADVDVALRSVFRRLLYSWVDGADPCLAKLAHLAVLGVHSVPPVKLMWPLKGEVAHLQGSCRPCIFALRDSCRETAAMCSHCHAEGHLPTKRASRRIRVARRARRRTPSADGLSE